MQRGRNLCEISRSRSCNNVLLTSLRHVARCLDATMAEPIVTQVRCSRRRRLTQCRSQLGGAAPDAAATAGGRRQVARHLRGAGNFSTPCNTRHSRLASILQFGYKNSNWSNEDRQNLQLATCLANLLQVTVTRLRLSHQQHKPSLPAIPSPVASSFSRAPVSRIMIVRESHRTAIGRLVWNVNATAAISANLCCTLIMVATN